MSTADIMLAIIAALGVYFAGKDLKENSKRNRADRTDKQQGDEIAQAKKITELEGKMESAYRELNIKVQSLERAIGEMKFSNATFETRFIASIDKLENKIDKLLMDFYTKKQN